MIQDVNEWHFCHFRRDLVSMSLNNAGVAELIKVLDAGDIYLRIWASLRFECGGPATHVARRLTINQVALDCLHVARQYKAKGLTYFTKVLPTLGKAIDALLLGDSDEFFKLLPVKEGLVNPFLRGIVEQVVLPDGTLILTDSGARAVKILRQLTFLFYKLELPYESRVKAEMLETFIEVDRSLPLFYERKRYDDIPSAEIHKTYETYAEIFGTTYWDAERTILDQSDQEFSAIRYLVRRVLSPVDPRTFRGRHGPGAVSTGERGVEKRLLNRYYSTLRGWTSYDETYLYNLNAVDFMLTPDGLDIEEPKYGSAKIVFVPKDSRGPRIISCEPLELQWIQQGLMTLMVERMESFWLTKGHVNFTDQNINRQLALKSSLTQELCTLDMKEASDRVSVAHIERYFPHTWQEALMASRSYVTRLPNGKVLSMKKFAPMGSAVCFPTEALLFWAISVASIYVKRISALGKPLSGCQLDLKQLRDAAATMYVYGDDLICEREDRAVVEQALERHSLVVNKNKSCSTGFFRESCGLDAFLGVEVQPVRFKRTLKSSCHLTPTELASAIAVSNRLWQSECCYTADIIETHLQKRRVPIPYRDSESAVLSEKDIYEIEKTGLIPIVSKGLAFMRPPGYRCDLSAIFHKRRYRLEFNFHTKLEQCYVLTPTKVYGDCDYAELLRWYTLREKIVSLEDLPRAGVYATPRSIDINLGWMPC